jgi:hypothetical protein
MVAVASQVTLALVARAASGGPLCAELARNELALERSGCIMRPWLVGVLIAALAVFLLPASRASAAPPTMVYFTQTGHSLGEPFLTYWRTHGGLAIYGYPLTEPLQEVSPYDNKPYTVQYFERARLEAQPENPAP